MTRKTGLVWLLLLFCTAVRASNLRQISSREGISNNAILSLAQDKHGFIWVGSCDGLNMWDGERMRLFPNDWGGETPLSGNLIEEIAVTTDSLFWIRTNYGLDLFDPDSKRVERHADFQGMYKIVTRRSNEVLVVTQDNKFSCYDPAARRFSSVQPMPGIDYADILDMQLDDDGALWVFSRKGIFRIPVAFPDKNNDRIGIGQPERFPTVSNPEYAFAENGSGFFIDENHIFYEFDIRERRLIYIKEMNDEMARMGSVSSIVRDGGDYIVSFYTNGVIRLRTTPEQSVKYATEHINIPCGVFSLLRDARQEIVWIGTDGQGLYQHTRNATAFRSITFNQLPYNLSKPVRALYIDDERTLWVGTKGEGILRIADFYDRKEFTPAHVQQLTADNSELLDNSVYAFARSRRNLLWIGTDGEGLNYYSYDDRRIRTLRTPAPLKYIHALYETSPDTLWVATVGCGVFRVTLGGTASQPSIRGVEQLHFNDELEIKNFFFTLYPENGSAMWFGNRGGGAGRGRELRPEGDALPVPDSRRWLGRQDRQALQAPRGQHQPCRLRYGLRRSDEQDRCNRADARTRRTDFRKPVFGPREVGSDHRRGMADQRQNPRGVRRDARPAGRGGLHHLPLLIEEERLLSERRPHGGPAVGRLQQPELRTCGGQGHDLRLYCLHRGDSGRHRDRRRGQHPAGDVLVLRTPDRQRRRSGDAGRDQRLQIVCRSGAECPLDPAHGGFVQDQTAGHAAVHHCKPRI